MRCMIQPTLPGLTIVRAPALTAPLPFRVLRFLIMPEQRRRKQERSQENGGAKI